MVCTLLLAIEAEDYHTSKQFRVFKKGPTNTIC